MDLEKEIFEKISPSRGKTETFKWGASKMKGWPRYMEDYYSAEMDVVIDPPKPCSYFGIFDGHGSHKVAEYLSKQLGKAVVKNIEDKPREKSRPSKESIRKAIYKTFFEEDEKLKKEILHTEKQSEDDYDYESGGSTACFLLIFDRRLFVATCGDSRFILGRNGKAELLSKDHKPTDELEKQRIIASGSVVINKRVNAAIAISRSFGDFDFKTAFDMKPDQQAIAVTPDIVVEKIDKTAELAILVSDGITDVFPESQDLYDFVKHLMQCTERIDDVCNQVMDTCYYKGSRDNMSMVIVAFNGVAPQFSKEAAAKEKEADEKFFRTVKDYATSCKGKGQSFIAAYELTAALTRDMMDKLQVPPGGGLAAKRKIIQKVLSEVNSDEH